MTRSGNQPRLDFVSPLPPIRSGIADYSVDLIPPLARRCDLRVLTLPGHPWCREIEERFPTAPVAEAGKGGRLPLYQMGNNQHHLEVFRAALRVPGVLTLHDFVLHHFHLGRLHPHDIEGYERLLEDDHGWEGRYASRAIRWGAYGDALQFALPAHRSLLRAQRGVLVHSSWAARSLAEEDPVIPVRVVPMGVPLPEPPAVAASQELRRRLAVPDTAPLLGSFGFQTPIKRTDTAIRALARPGLERAHLLVAGELSPYLDLAGEAKRAGVADRVHLLGFVPFEELGAAIVATDLCLNLRFPSAGETSASLLRVLALGRPAVVSDYGQFAELPDAAVVKVPVDGDEPGALAAQLAGLLETPERLTDMGRAARALVAREHSPERAAAAIVEACLELAELAPPGPEARRLPPPSSLIWGELPGSLEVIGAENPWPPGERRNLQVIVRNEGPARWLAADRGEGGVALEVRLLGQDDEPLETHPWIPLPRDLEPGESWAIELPMRRPPVPCRLVLEPRVLEVGSLRFLRGTRWEKAL
jgi:glycosyltransferase involved in cell wall biosynthesis